MSNGVVLWIAGFLGWPPEVIVILATLFFIFAPFYIFLLLVKLFMVMVVKYRRSSGGHALVLLLFLIPLGIVVFVGELILTILALVAGVSLAHDFRNWWHKGRYK